MYKAGQGMPSRVGTMIVGVLIAFYASHSWYRWHPFSAVGRSAQLFSVDFVVSLVLLVGIVALFGWLAFRRPGSADYLIDMDDELRKVVWPSVMPLFDPKTEAWGSTYVVIVCAILFTIFIWLVDLILQYVVTYGLFQSWLFA
ncbi:MAG: preprotein translocase subunit SecE [Planctomycetes bacterium]|nr:preprotein translocase subunit SecE [Planctomycetota bacterium]MCD7898049.1 preprotein translocase subunit SecE [Planctomycetaceae bacterium]